MPEKESENSRFYESFSPNFNTYDIPNFIALLALNVSRIVNNKSNIYNCFLFLCLSF